PEAVLALAACVLFIGGTIRANRPWWGTVALAALAAAGGALWATAGETRLLAGAGSPLLVGPLALLIKIIALPGGPGRLLVSWDDVPDSQASDYHGCLLLTVAGLSLTASANDLVTLFLSLELISIPTYLLLYLPRVGGGVQEGAVKYFLLSVFSSALLLFGF